MWHWIPNKSLGNINLGESLSSVKSKHSLLGHEADPITGWATYYIKNDDVYVDCEDDTVVSITSFKNFTHLGKNCIGINIIELGAILGVLPDEIGDPVEYDDNDIKVPREYFDLGLQVWTTNNIVSSMTCLTYEDL
ncbi:hypothetical protein ACSLBF_17685 (plasmid) [Pseudoalteromonas sp. T1lg65]|uniref:hypothetical protein n=1 Tax=Pseudoalteromonas sp. T1lg65 TaxID=2077101 RepID=UPI003F7A7DC5